MPFDLDRYRVSLTASAVGRRVEYREQTSTTFDDARALLVAEPDVAPGTACIAGEQTAGRGRLGRSFVSAAGVGLYVTYHLRPAVAANASLISLAAGLAVVDAVAVVSGVEAGLKWPNDVLFEGRKLCGILAESRGSGDRLDVFLGIGINVQPNPNHPPEVAAIAISLEEIAGTAPAIEDLAAALSNALERRVEEVDRDPDGVVADWRAELVTLGQRVTINTAAGGFTGMAVDVGSRGELVIEDDHEERREFSAGDVVIPGSSGRRSEKFPG